MHTESAGLEHLREELQQMLQEKQRDGELPAIALSSKDYAAIARNRRSSMARMAARIVKVTRRGRNSVARKAHVEHMRTRLLRMVEKVNLSALP